MSRSEFVENLYSLPRVYSSEIYTSADIATKIAILQSGKPNFPQKEVTRWKRVHERFKLLSHQGTNILYLRKRKNQPAKRVLSTKELFEIIQAERGYISVLLRNSTVLLRVCVAFSLSH